MVQMKFMGLAGRLAYGFGIVAAVAAIVDTANHPGWLAAAAGALIGLGAAFGWDNE
jgi:hypothetical protein